MNNKKIISILMVITIGLATVGCGEKTTDNKQAKQQAEILIQQDTEVGLPNIKEFSEKKMAKEILELRDNSKLITYAYTKNEMNGKFIFIGQCVGYGLPYSTQYTNPERMPSQGESPSTGNITIPQADPNGLFMPSSADATWIQYINPDTGKREVSYIEDKINIFQSKLPRNKCEEWSLSSNY